MRTTKSVQHPHEFKTDAVRLVLAGDRSLRQVAADLGVNHWTLRDWYRKETMSKRPKRDTQQVATVAAPETPAEQVKRLTAEVKRLQKENNQLTEDREILKKAAAFFAKESE